ncbi:anthranilate phosphoribosyltransferase [Pseudoalteromonas tunicata]|jgi:anthranilate phosphoribosyltransferase|uniref:Anthranilate phosphoribosyltransferase n=1 Tax=Pseudoalteromonas tunicata D2 TaxID=87626 RepID=A4CBJ8_9GAMM|nr:anthranilate phosphoribosyltransferase [Pseudoalteromonas tunicata]ATC94292.1 anthranilate phosphoribosyltransferase [Pseudoalteromonas tunicata]AXT30035.1 anthranilate phosphoribosyltransferase [Pseudoalteromonas tunicata]EAR27735.1 Anthranilate phosphoribosyltransferase [Pseudoalteromonas tunicata D2]MDP4982072.1 anthranilate phosphoribosyltransferase [Pseudoalteromonas tunicata]MDP5211513.1 anthranilate phosphoribosyltransferase [Pseudoalteromonas tunicata]
MEQLIQQVIDQQDLSFTQAEQFFNAVMQGEINEIQLTAALVALKIKQETPDEIAGAAQAMRANAVPFTTSLPLTADSCGTGGDGSNTINISTTAAIVAAACGLNMVKHGNKSVSSNSGSADLLTALGINIAMTPEQASTCLSKTGFTFLFAPLYHSGVKHAMPVRNALKTRTIFNILGPLANPAAPQVQLLGVYDPALCMPLAQTLNTLGCRRAMVVHGAGTDEIALHGDTLVVELNNGEINEYSVSPADFDLEHFTLSELAGAGPESNAAASRAILNGQGTPAHNAAIIANVAALLYLSGLAQNFKEGANQVRQVLSSGVALATLNGIVEASHG